MAQAAGRHHHRRSEMEHPPAVSMNGHGADHLGPVQDQVDREGAVDPPHLRRMAHGRHQGAHDLRPRGISRVQDAAAAVGGLPAEGQSAGVVEIEMGAEREERLHPLRPLGGQQLHRPGVVQPRAGGQGVRRVKGRSVVLPYRGGDAPLGPGARAAGALAHLGEHRHPQGSAA